MGSQERSATENTVMKTLIKKANSGTQLIGLLGLYLAMFIATAGFGIYYMNAIEKEMGGISERSLPITASISAITTHQLEQTVLFERAMGYARVSTPSALEHLEESETAFFELDAQVTQEIKDAEAHVAEAIKAADTAEARSEYKTVLEGLTKIEEEHKSFSQHAEEAFKAAHAGDSYSLNGMIESIEAEADKLDHELEALLHEMEAFTQSTLDTVKAHEHTALVILATLAAIGIAVGGFISFVIVRMTSRVNRQADESSRVKAALDNTTTNVMVADTDLNIVYMNHTMVDMLKAAETELRKDLPNFNSDNLLGTCVDVFHKNPSHQRGMIERLSEPFHTSIEVGSHTFNLIASPVKDAAGNRIGTVVEWDDVTEKLAREREERRIANENMRIRSALDRCQTNVMVADDDYDIVYLNDTLTGMLANAESDIRKDLPQFQAGNVIGKSIDTFHKNPDHQRRMLDGLSGTHKTELKIGGRIFALIVSPVKDAEQNRIGTVVEWQDITMERSVEAELNTVVQAAVAGDFTQRVATDDKTGFMLNMAQAINELSETCDKGLNDVGDMVRSLAEGDLTVRITADYQGLFNQLKEDSNGMADRLSEIVKEMVEAATEVSNAASEITAGSADLSQRTEDQASSLEETAASMEEMAATVKTNAENAEQANHLGASARQVATNGGEVVGEAVTAMARIEESSQKISDIIGVIDEIAFQTNLLALNAAVEAARAGEAGKGFAVVASEVRTLAQRSSEAAKDIKGLILDSGSQVKDGVQLVNKAGETLTEIVDSIKRVTDLVSEIAAASKEQSSGVEEINSAVSSMDEMTQQNSALVEENAAAAKTLEEQAIGMTERMGFFKVDNSKAGFGGVSQQQAKLSQEVSSFPAQKAAPKPAPKPAAPAKKVAAAGGSGGDDDWAEF